MADGEGDLELLQAIADTLPVMVAYWDRDLRCRFSNRAYDLWITGGAPVRGRRMADVLSGERLRIGEALQRDVMAGNPQRLVREGVSPSGERRMMEIISVPHAVDGVVVGAVTAVYDVSAHEQVRRDVAAANEALVAQVAQGSAALAASEAFIGFITDQLPNVVVYWDRALVCRFANRAARLRMIGRDAPVAGKALAELLSGEPLERALARINAGLRGEPQVYDRVVVGADGREHLYQTVMVPDLVDGACRGVIAVATDLSDRHQATQSLAHSERRFRAMIERAPVAVVTVGPAGMVALANAAAERMFGVEPDALVGLPIEALLPAGEGGTADAARQAFLAAAGPGRLEVSGCRADGTRFPVEVALSLMELSGGPQILAYIVDTTERTRLAAERAEVARKLTEAQHLESLGVLAGGIAHDFNNLLTGVLGSASLLLDTVGERDLPLVAGIKHAAERAAELCQQILAYAGRGKTVVARADLSQLVRDTTSLIAASVSKRATVRLHLASGVASVNADAVQLRQVIMNLVINAGEALGAHDGDIDLTTGVVELDAADLADAVLADDAQPGHFAFFEVQDTGPGVAPELRARIFEPFFTTKFTGRGLGLAAVRGILRAHGGVLFLRSTPGRGACFRVCLPALLPVPVSDRSLRSRVTWRGDGKCLVIDDEPAVRTTCQAALERLGFTVELANDGEAGLTQFENDPMGYTLALIDLSMPRLGGVATYLEMRRVRADVPVVFMSGKRDHDLEDDLGSVGPYVFVAKPFDLAVLTAAIRKVLDPRG